MEIQTKLVFRSWPKQLGTSGLKFQNSLHSCRNKCETGDNGAVMLLSCYRLKDNMLFTSREAVVVSPLEETMMSFLDHLWSSSLGFVQTFQSSALPCPASHLRCPLGCACSNPLRLPVGSFLPAQLCLSLSFPSLHCLAMTDLLSFPCGSHQCGLHLHLVFAALCPCGNAFVSSLCL